MGALDGLRVIDAGVLVQAPQAAALLGQFGADVIKVELPGFGAARSSPPTTAASAASPSTCGSPPVASSSSG